ncbi:AP-5 complex subunit beta-1-like [Littorina saxatilis]
MAATRRRVADDGRQTLSNIRRNLSKGTVEKLFEDESFVFELLDALYEEEVDVTVKTELLAVLEQYGLDRLEASCAEQVAARLLDVLQEQRGSSDRLRFVVQLMLTLTSLVVTNDMLKTEPCGSLVSHLWEIVGRVNDVPSRRLRGCACQCLRQLETWSPGLLSRYKDRLVQAMREERTHVFQDYATLLSTVLTNLSARGDSTPADSIPADEVVPPLSFLMDNAFLFTPSGLWPVVLSVMELVKTTVHVAPSIFKPLMLQNLTSVDPCMLHIVLYIQKAFQGEILTAEEESQLLQRLTSGVNILTLRPAQRLLILQWIKAYLQQGGAEELQEEETAGSLQRVLHPTVFDSLDIHVDKLNVLTRSYPTDEDHNLGEDIHYLKRLALTTGNDQATVGLYRVLFAAYTHHQTQRVSDAVIKITQDLVVDYPHLIPLILDFLLAIKETLSDSTVYQATLSSLHSQVLSARQAEVLSHFRFYLQVLSASAKQPHIQQQKTIQFLVGLVRYAESSGACDWELGCAVLTVCRNLLLHHCSDYIYYDLGELLFEMQTSFSDCDIRNRARLLYALLAGASDEKLRDVLGSKLLGGVVLSQNITNMLTGSSQNLGKAEVIHMEKTGLEWQRVSLTPVFSSLESPSDLVHSLHVTGRLESYFQHLAYLKAELVYQYTLSLSETSEYEVLSAVSVRLKASTETFTPAPDIHLLSISKLGSKELTLRLVPRVPQPSVIDVQAMFCTEDHSTVSCLLDPVGVTFTDLTLTLPWQELGVDVLQDRHCVFDELWAVLTADSNHARQQGVESVKVVQCATDRIHRALNAFHLPHPSGDEGIVDKYLMFLPPSYHLLLQVVAQSNKQVVSMATDYWQILPCVSNYLNTIDSAT